MKFSLPPLSKKDWIIVVLVFLITLLSSELVMTIDETPLEAPGMIPWYWAPIGTVGFLLCAIVNIPILMIEGLLHQVFGGEGTSIYLMTTDHSFSIAPIISSLFYAFLVMVMLDPRGKKKNETKK